MDGWIDEWMIGSMHSLGHRLVVGLFLLVELLLGDLVADLCHILFQLRASQRCIDTVLLFVFHQDDVVLLLQVQPAW